MAPSVLLLDCSDGLYKKLKRQGFDVEQGTIGFCTGERKLPCQIYEREILIYNPSSIADSVFQNVYGIKTITPEYKLSYLDSHISRGATLLIFVNRVADDLKKQRRAYDWIPSMPEINFTKDRQVLTVDVGGDTYYESLTPIISPDALKFPILQKLSLTTPPGLPSYLNNRALFVNKNHDILAAGVERGDGRLIILPEYQSNEEIVGTFLHRVLPKIYEQGVQVGLIDQFWSPEEVAIDGQVRKAESDIETLVKELETYREKLATANRNKINTIKADETAVLVLNYYDLATRQDDVALFYLYKVTEALNKKYGREKVAKTALDCNQEWKRIRERANVSYADMRHAPGPGEKLKEWGQEEIEECFEDARKIINTYLATLF